jgi:hypothetical protein
LFNFTTNTTYHVIGFDFYGLNPGAIVGLGQFIVTDTVHIGACLNRESGHNWVEPQTSIDSGAPDNVCIFNDDQKRFYTAPTTGSCFCDKPFAGPTCEFPALPLPFAESRRHLHKAICGGFGAIGNSYSGVAITDSGAYYENNRVLCKCRDIGKVLRSVLDVRSAFADTFLERYDSTSTFNDLATSGLASTSVFKCAAVGTILPSWLTSNDIERFLGTWDGIADVVVDVTFNDQQLVWESRSTEIIGDPIPVVNNDCPGTEICRALNFQNLAYSPNQTLTNGLLTDFSLFTIGIVSVNVTRAPLPPWNVVIWTNETFSGAFQPSGCTFTSSSPMVFACSTSNVTTVAITLNSNVYIAEVHVMEVI